VDASSEDSNVVLPLLGFSVSQSDARGMTSFSFDWAHTSQLPGYTVLKSRPTGLFGGNPDLGREEARQMTVSLSRDSDRWQGSAAVFHRADDDLVDWTFSTGAPFVRQANAVDIDVLGVELLFTAQWESFELATGYTYLDKDADYGTALVDASFYALNFARHRATLALRYRFAEPLELRLDNEYRTQQDNPLRTSSSEAYLASLAIAWEPPGGRGIAATLTIDNLTDSDYQPFPGTPAMGRQFSLSVSYAW
jgi:outer membrane receptor protein involved in Fe transport